MLEVVIAITILALGGGAMLAITANSLGKINHAYRSVMLEHNLVQAAEFLLLCGTEAKFDNSLLQPGYEIDYTVSPIQLPKYENIDYNYKWQLKPIKLKIEIRDSDADLCSQITIDSWQK